MIICSCNIISDTDIRNVIGKLRKNDANALLTPGRVYRALGKRAQCGSCLDNAIAVILDEQPNGMQRA